MKVNADRAVQNRVLGLDPLLVVVVLVWSLRGRWQLVPRSPQREEEAYFPPEQTPEELRGRAGP